MERTEAGVSLADGWSFNDNGGNPGATLTTPENGTLRIEPQGKAEKSWHNQLHREKVAVELGQQLTLEESGLVSTYVGNGLTLLNQDDKERYFCLRSEALEEAIRRE